MNGVVLLRLACEAFALRGRARGLVEKSVPSRRMETETFDALFKRATHVAPLGWGPEAMTVLPTFDRADWQKPGGRFVKAPAGRRFRRRCCGDSP